MEVDTMLVRSDGSRAAPTPCSGTLTPTTTGPDPFASGPVSDATDEQLLDLICNDPELLTAEFDAIVAAEWPTPPVEHRRHATAAGPPDRTLGRLTLEVTTLASRPRHPGIGGWARERSPPRSGVTAQTERSHHGMQSSPTGRR
jgi:hypothetical protein